MTCRRGIDEPCTVGLKKNSSVIMVNSCAHLGLNIMVTYVQTAWHHVFVYLTTTFNCAGWSSSWLITIQITCTRTIAITLTHMADYISSLMLCRLSPVSQGKYSPSHPHVSTHMRFNGMNNTEGGRQQATTPRILTSNLHNTPYTSYTFTPPQKKREATR